MDITVKRLDSGYYHIRAGRMLWAQPRIWPCDEETFRAATFQGDSGWAGKFIKAAMKLAETA